MEQKGDFIRFVDGENKSKTYVSVPDGCEAVFVDENTVKFIPALDERTAAEHRYYKVAKSLFSDEKHFELLKGHFRIAEIYDLHMVTIRQAQKLVALNKLMNVAYYLNGKWRWEFKNGKNSDKFVGYFPILTKDGKGVDVGVSYNFYGGDSCVYFKTEEDAYKAIEILGEENIKRALSTDW